MSRGEKWEQPANGYRPFCWAGFGVAGWRGGLRATEPLQFSDTKSRILHLVLYALAGLLFGIMSTFHLQRVVHRPLVFVTVAAVAGMLLVGWLFRKEKSAR